MEGSELHEKEHGPGSCNNALVEDRITEDERDILLADIEMMQDDGTRIAFDDVDEEFGGEA